MAKKKKVSFEIDEILPYFDALEDPRSSINQLHPLVSVVVISLMAVLAGANGPTAIARWANMKEDLLRKLLPLPHGVPQKDVYRRVLSLLKPEAFQACFTAWLSSLRAEATAAGGVEQPILAVDGKTLRRSHDEKKGLGPLHSVSIWATELGLSLGQKAAAEKSNEITAIPELLRSVDVQGAIITIDAMGTQTAIAEQIVAQGADYVLALKGNQVTTHAEISAYIDRLVENDFADVGARRHATKEKGHGREEERLYVQMSAPTDLPALRRWAGLKTIGIAVSTCLRAGKQTAELRYYLSSLELGVKNFARAVRRHWGIENSCHWTLDFTYREDESRIRDKHVRENFAWLNRFTLSLLKQHPDKASLVMKRRSCGWSDHFLTQVVTGATL
jgi:predicted transposase YbfD/YdcC